MKKLVLLSLLVLALAAPAGAGTVTFRSFSGDYHYGSGGEFTFHTDGPNPLNLDYYVNNKTSNIGSYDPSFQTFCVEETEYIQNGYTYNYSIDTYAVGGGKSGATGGQDPLSKGAAWLYAQFASGTLKDYNYANTGGGRANSANALQQALWYLEGEVDPATPNTYVAYVYSVLGAAVAAEDANGAYGVKVLNLTSVAGYCADGIRATNCQSQFYYVPDGGATLMLLGGALVGIAALRRKFRL